MIFNLTVTPEIKITARRCYDCGRWYGFEESNPASSYCALNALRGSFKKLKQAK